MSGKLQRWRQALLHRVALLGGRLLMPHVGRNHEEELSSGAYDMAGAEPECIRIEDVGADTTIFSFSSAGFLHPGGMPTFAFTDLFARQKEPFNLVFLRDVHRTAYHLTPAGANTGLAYHEQIVSEAMTRLGAARNIAIGESSGAAAAVHFGTRCGMDEVLAFSLPYPMQAWTSWAARLRALCNLRLLFRDPGAYWEVLMITGFSVLAHRSLLRTVGPDGICDPVRTYREAERRPALMLYYGQDCRPDREIAQTLASCEETTLVPVPTSRHMLWIPLARMGGLEARIMGPIREGVSGSQVRSPSG